MTPAEVREVLKRMWRNNTDILSMLYAVENKHVPRSSKIHSIYEDIYEMFFIQTVPVAPNKFRAPSKLGDQVFEHPQNTLLVTIINANLDLVTYSNKASTEFVDANQVSPLLTCSSPVAQQTQSNPNSKCRYNFVLLQQCSKAITAVLLALLPPVCLSVSRGLCGILSCMVVIHAAIWAVDMPMPNQETCTGTLLEVHI